MANELRIHQHADHGIMMSVTDLCHRAGMKGTNHIIERLQSKVTKGHLVLGSKVTICHLDNERGGHPIWYVNKAGAYAILTSRNITISEATVMEIMDAFKGQAVISASVAPDKMMEALLQQGDQILSIIQSQDRRISVLESKPEYLQLPMPIIKIRRYAAPTQREKLNELMKAITFSKFAGDFRAAWVALYSAYHQAGGLDFMTLGKAMELDPIDCAEEKGLIPDLYKFAKTWAEYILTH